MKKGKERWPDIAERYKSGQTLKEIGDHYGVTRERIRQILRKMDISRDEGGRAIMVAERLRALEEEKDKRCIEHYGCTRAQWERIRGKGPYLKSPLSAFHAQRANALRRDIPWELSLWDWWQLWQRSGKWKQRGRGHKEYGLIRIDMDKGFTKDNVKVMKNEVGHRASSWTRRRRENHH